jgi:proteasome accessory factor A
MKPFLMGTETEYAVSGRSSKRGQIAAEEVYGLLNDALRKERLFLPDVGGGRAMYLQHGGRFYMDSGGHPEYASPECSTPAQVVAYDKAGERLMQIAQARIKRDLPEYELSITKNNIGPVFPDRVTWGCHESHVSWLPLDRVGPMLMPQLVSRTIYCGAGVLSARNNGLGFELSQRARHLVQATGSETTSNRAIYCTRIRKASDVSNRGWQRLHLISKDSQRAPLGIYLTFGTTGLLMLLINDGIEVGKGLQLSNPVQALQQVSLDPWLKARVTLADGRRLTALEIQEVYLAQAERELVGRGFPDWTADVIRHWRETLEELGKDPLRMAGKLDPYCKLLIFEHELRRAGFMWGDLHRSLKTVEMLRAGYPEPVVRAVLSENPKGLPQEMAPKYPEAVAATKAETPGVLDRLRFAVRLQALELKYHELGGLYDQLAAAGKAQAVVVTPEMIEHATWEPPAGGRAAIRGECVKSLRDPGWLCDWRYVYHNVTGQLYDLRDPWETQKKVVAREQFDAGDLPETELMDLLERLRRR